MKPIHIGGDHRLKKDHSISFKISELLDMLDIGRGPNGKGEYFAYDPFKVESEPSLHITPRDDNPEYAIVYRFGAEDDKEYAKQLREYLDDPNPQPTEKNEPIKFTKAGVVSSLDPEEWWVEKTSVPWELWERLGCKIEPTGVGFTFPTHGYTKLRFTGTKKYEWDPSGQDDTPPLWPELPTTLPEIIYLTEGESDTGSAWALGFHAHGLTKGTGTPINSRLIKSIRDRGANEIRVLFDADKSGYDAAIRVDETAIAVSGVKIVPIDISNLLDPETNQKDLNDLVRAIPEKSWPLVIEKIEQLAAEAPVRQPFTISGEEYFDKYSESPGALIWGWLDRSSVGFLTGREGSFKSWLALGLSLTVANGKSFMGFPKPAASGKVLFFPMEDSHFMTLNRIALIAGFWSGWEDGDGPIHVTRSDGGTTKTRNYKVAMPRVDLKEIMANIIVHDSREFNFENDAWITRLEEDIARYTPELVVIDPLFAATGIESMRDFMASVAQKVARDLKRLRDRYGCGFLIVHHMTNTTGEMWGSAFLKAAREFRIDTEVIDGGVRVSRYTKAQGKMPALDVMFSQHSGPLEVTIGLADFSRDKPGLNSLQLETLIVLKDNGTEEGLTIREINELINDDSLGEYDLKNAVNRLRESDPPLMAMLNEPKRGRAGQYGITNEGIAEIAKTTPKP